MSRCLKFGDIRHINSCANSLWLCICKLFHIWLFVWQWQRRYDTIDKLRAKRICCNAVRCYVRPTVALLLLLLLLTVVVVVVVILAVHHSSHPQWLLTDLQHHNQQYTNLQRTANSTHTPADDHS
eukprot:GHVS01002993.1.p1 GENE.GHVS01002993.1~~GHVS01002993.1.p1  ORF type:complete len:125 (-),score=20.67 GHVS01002993.1:127-501(-)